jgi:hypothetical protein
MISYDFIEYQQNITKANQKYFVTPQKGVCETVHQTGAKLESPNPNPNPNPVRLRAGLLLLCGNK